MMGSSNDNEDLDISSVTLEESLLSANTGFDEEGFDDVFVDDPLSADLESPTEIPIPARRTSDVIDCIGELSGSWFHTPRHSSSSAPGEIFSSAISQATNIITVEPTGGRRTLESIDLGYSSPGAPYSNVFTKEHCWFRTCVNSDADSIDAKPIGQKEENIQIPANNEANNESNSSCEMSKTTENVETMSVIKDEFRYNMDHKYRGFAVIINNEFFETDKLGERTGSQKDVEELITAFNKLDFFVVVWNNFAQKQIFESLKDMAARDHSDNDCLAMVVLTHGLGASYLYAKDAPYHADLLWNSFTPEKCKTLAGKPKLFFVQACRGDKFDCGYLLSRETNTQVDSSAAAYKIPTFSDFLITYSAYEGHYSFRHPVYGTWFIQSLCSELNKHDLEYIDFLSVMTRVNRRVALYYASHTPDTPWLNGMKQVPAVHHMLIRDLYFKRKNAPPPDPEIV